MLLFAVFMLVAVAVLLLILPSELFIDDPSLSRLPDRGNGPRCSPAKTWLSRECGAKVDTVNSGAAEVTAKVSIAVALLPVSMSRSSLPVPDDENTVLLANVREDVDFQVVLVVAVVVVSGSGALMLMVLALAAWKWFSVPTPASLLPVSASEFSAPLSGNKDEVFVVVRALLALAERGLKEGDCSSWQSSSST